MAHKPHPAYSVHFGAKARTFIYRDHEGPLLFGFNLRHEGEGFAASRWLVFSPEAYAEDGSVASVSRERHVEALQRVKDFARQSGYSVD